MERATRFRLVLEGRTEDPARQAAWRELCAASRDAVEAFFRRRFEGRRAPQELVEAFFAYLRSFRPGPGASALRPHVARALAEFVHDLHRGSIGLSPAPLTPFAREEERRALATGREAFVAEHGDDAFDGDWARSLLLAAVRRVTAGGVEELKAFTLGYLQRGTPEGSAMRAELRRRFLDEVRETVAAEDAFEAERDALLPHVAGAV